MLRLYSELYNEFKNYTDNSYIITKDSNNLIKNFVDIYSKNNKELKGNNIYEKFINSNIVNILYSKQRKQNNNSYIFNINSFNKEFYDVLFDINHVDRINNSLLIKHIGISCEKEYCDNLYDLLIKYYTTPMTIDKLLSKINEEKYFYILFLYHFFNKPYKEIVLHLNDYVKQLLDYISIYISCLVDNDDINLSNNALYYANRKIYKHVFRNMTDPMKYIIKCDDIKDKVINDYEARCFNIEFIRKMAWSFKYDMHTSIKYILDNLPMSLLIKYKDNLVYTHVIVTNIFKIIYNKTINDKVVNYGSTKQ